MRKAILLLCAAVCFAPAVFAQTLSQADREKGIKYLEQTRDAIVADTKNLTPAQWNFKPAPDKWSVAQTLEHITLAEDSLSQLVADKVMKSPQARRIATLPKWTRWSSAMVPDRSTKRQAPPELVPTGTLDSRRNSRSFPAKPCAHHRIPAHHSRSAPTRDG